LAELFETFLCFVFCDGTSCDPAEQLHTIINGWNYTSKLCGDGQTAWIVPKKSRTRADHNPSPRLRGQMTHALLKVRRRLPSETYGVRERTCDIAPLSSLVQGILSAVAAVSYDAENAAKSHFLRSRDLKIWKYEKDFVSLYNTRWQSHRPTHSTFIYRIGMMLLTVLHFFVFILTNTTG